MNTEKNKIPICVYLCSSVALFFSLTACGHYADFTLPQSSGGNPAIAWRFEARAEPVLAREDMSDVLNPSVAGQGNNQWNLYSAFDGKTWHTALASSSDGLHWLKQGVVLSPDPHTWEGSYIAANGSALSHGGQYWYWYQAGAKGSPRIGLARAPDARTWRKQATPVMELGPVGSWDERAVADPYVIRLEPYFYMYYLGQDRAARQRLGVARSTDGVRWEKLRSNPILDLDDEVGLGEPAVWQSDGFYWMLYTVRDPGEKRHLAMARSTDGVHFTKLGVKLTGGQAWNSQVICDPTVLLENGKVKVWFGGGDAASPDENLHGQIGFATLEK
jgi:predicted GH43/DUF377 family glycosyl hydrolase